MTDPIDAPAPFVAGVHFLEAPSDQLADLIRSMLADRARRLEIARAAQRFLTEELTLIRQIDALVKATG